MVLRIFLYGPLKRQVKQLTCDYLTFTVISHTESVLCVLTGREPAAAVVQPQRSPNLKSTRLYD